MKNENCDRKSTCDDYKYNHCDGCGANKPIGDLISRSALKKHITEIFEREEKIDKKWSMGLKYSLKIIDNAPTVFTCNACKNMGNERECVDCHDYSNYVHYEERPQGEWEKVDKRYDTNSHRMFVECECDQCHWHEEFTEDDETGNVLTSAYCPYCGSSMRKEAKDETN